MIREEEMSGKTHERLVQRMRRLSDPSRKSAFRMNQGLAHPENTARPQFSQGGKIAPKQDLLPV